MFPPIPEKDATSHDEDVGLMTYIRCTILNFFMQLDLNSRIMYIKFESNNEFNKYNNYILLCIITKYDDFL
jgi:hypothetical protein